MKIISIILILVSAFLGVKHGWDAFQPANAEGANLMAGLGISKAAIPVLGIASIAGLMLLFPQTFFIANLLNAFSIVLIMALSLRAGQVTIALMEIPFLIIPLLLTWLKYPFTFQ